MNPDSRVFFPISALFLGRESRFTPSSRLELRKNPSRPSARNFPSTTPVTPLPERKKTAEELEEMRVSLGVPEQLPPAAPGAGLAGRERVELPKEKGPVSPAVERAAKLGEENSDPGPEESEGQGKSASPEAGAPSVPPPKPVRSLKRSEREPRELPARKRKPLKNSDLPVHRHSDQDLQRLRMQNAMEAKPPIEQINAQGGHWALLALGYLLAFAGGIGGFAVAAFLFFKKPRSSHHAAWMTIIAVLVLVFGILYLLSKTDGP